MPINICNVHWAFAVIKPASSSTSLYDSLGAPDSKIGDNTARWATDEVKARDGPQMA